MKLTRRSYALLGGGVLVLAMALAAARVATNTNPVTLPSGTAIHVTLEHALASNQQRAGDGFNATVSSPVVVNGKTVIPQGAEARGRVVDARESGHLEGVARLSLALSSVDVNGRTYDLETTTITRRGGDHKKRNWLWIGGGSGFGALLGGIAGGGKGAAIGAASGAGAGTAAAALTGKKEIRLPAETALLFKTTQPVVVQVKS